MTLAHRREARRIPAVEVHTHGRAREQHAEPEVGQGYHRTGEEEEGTRWKGGSRAGERAEGRDCGPPPPPRSGGGGDGGDQKETP